MKACVECKAEIRDAAAYCDVCGRDQAATKITGFTKLTGSHVDRGTYEGTTLDLPFRRLPAGAKKLLATLWGVQREKMGKSNRMRTTLIPHRDGKPRPPENDAWMYLNDKGFVAYSLENFAYYLSDCGMDYCELHADELADVPTATIRKDRTLE